MDDKTHSLTSSIKRNGKDTISWRDSKNRIVDSDFSYVSLALSTPTPPDCTCPFRLWTSISFRKLTLMFNPIVEKLSGLINSTVPLHLMFFINDPKFLSSRLTRRFNDCLNCCSFWPMLEVLSSMFALPFMWIHSFLTSVRWFRLGDLRFASHSVRILGYRAHSLGFRSISLRLSEAPPIIQSPFCSGSYMAVIAIIAEFRSTHFFHQFRFIHLLTPFRPAFTRKIVRIWVIPAMKHPALCVNEPSHLFGFRFDFIRFTIDRFFLLDELSQLFFLLRIILLKLFQLVLPRVEQQRERFLTHGIAKSVLNAFQSLLHKASLAVQNWLELRNIAIFLRFESFRKTMLECSNLQSSQKQSKRTRLCSVSIWFFVAMNCDFRSSTCRCSFLFWLIWSSISLVASSFVRIYTSLQVIYLNSFHYFL